MMYLSVFIYIVIGVCVGSFLNVIIYRLPIMLSRSVLKNTVSSPCAVNDIFKNKFNLCLPKSFCPGCYSPLPVKYNIPIFGWLFLRGITKCCNKKINPRYLIVELLTAFLTLIVVLCSKSDYLAVISLFLIWSLITLSFIDLDCYLLPDCITLPLLWLGLIININHTFCSLSFAVLGATVGYIFLWLPSWLFKFIKGIEGMGQGDFKLMAALGAWFGVSAIPILILLSSSLGIIISIAISRLSKKEIRYIAFGPYIALAGGGYLFMGEYITNLLSL
ncbi:prepilin peptidase [Yersinia pekkanenii]|uniref:Prepilin leader peptidase/N-methyltransferase n=1 Tax=Yersinia pekkanenii TaxID=1288385 RepID=A0A0T9P8Y0_9GAMM|nr:A24 family peptidase [Yersinia pekkanenii]CNH51948.1 prepilin peptidase [Yersinia pekkanenii]CRY67835.1 prepilin peptidase [Yersinia pekkanenii]